MKLWRFVFIVSAVRANTSIVFNTQKCGTGFLQRAAVLLETETVFRTHYTKTFLEIYNKLDANETCKILSAVRTPFKMVPSLFFEKNRNNSFDGCDKKNVEVKYRFFISNLKKHILDAFSFSPVKFLIDYSNIDKKNISELKKSPIYFTFQKGNGPKCETLILNMDYVKLWPKYLGDFFGNRNILKNHKTWESRKELCPSVKNEIDYIYSHPNIDKIYPLLTNFGKKIWKLYGNF